MFTLEFLSELSNNIVSLSTQVASDMMLICVPAVFLLLRLNPNMAHNNLAHAVRLYTKHKIFWTCTKFVYRKQVLFYCHLECWQIMICVVAQNRLLLHSMQWRVWSNDIIDRDWLQSWVTCFLNALIRSQIVWVWCIHIHTASHKPIRPYLIPCWMI